MTPQEVAEQVHNRAVENGGTIPLQDVIAAFTDPHDQYALRTALQSRLINRRVDATGPNPVAVVVAPVD